MNEDIERRKEPRVKVSWLAEIFFDDLTVEAEVQNITVEGLYLCCEEPLPFKETLRMAIYPEGEGPIQIIGKIVWSDFYGVDEKQSAVCLGISFMKISEEDRQRLIAALTALMEQGG